jgi:hypothetical protein
MRLDLVIPQDRSRLALAPIRPGRVFADASRSCVASLFSASQRHILSFHAGGSEV